MNYCVIDGKEYDVLVERISESFEILYSEKTGRSVAVGSSMILDPLGTFYGHKVTLRRRRGKEKEFDDLWNYISTPRYRGMKVKMAHNQSILEYDAYVSKGERSLKHIDEKTGVLSWDALELNIVPMTAQVLPYD